MCRLKKLSQIVHKSCSIYICERRNSQPDGCTRERAQRHVSTPILSYQLVLNACESQIVVDRNTSQQIMLFFLVQHRSRSPRLGNMIRCILLRFVDVIRSDAMVPIVEAIVLIGKKFWQPKNFPRSTRLSRLTSRHVKI